MTATKRGCQNAECVSNERAVKTSGPSWPDIVASQPKFFWNRIEARREDRQSDAELLTAIEQANGDAQKILGLIRQGGKIDVAQRRCEYCDDALLQGDKKE